VARPRPETSRRQPSKIGSADADLVHGFFALQNKTANRLLQESGKESGRIVSMSGFVQIPAIPWSAGARPRAERHAHMNSEVRSHTSGIDQAPMQRRVASGQELPPC